MSRYSDWLVQQDTQFITEVCMSHPIPNKFKDLNYKSITLEELENLDNMYICPTELD